MTDLKTRTMRFIDDHDHVETLSGGIYAITDNDARRSIMHDLKEMKFDGEAMVQFEWHHAEQCWYMNVYGEDNPNSGFGYIFSKEDIDLKIPEPRPPEELSHGGERVEFVWRHDRKCLNDIADRIIKIAPDADRYAILDILDRHLTFDGASVEINDTTYKLVRP